MLKMLKRTVLHTGYASSENTYSGLCRQCSSRYDHTDAQADLDAVVYNSVSLTHIKMLVFA